jgi:hypothetical protein
MGLIQPSGPSWAYCTHNLPTDIDVTALGTVCTPGTEDSDGTAVDLFGAALAHDVEYLRLAISATVPGASTNDILLTVLVDPAGGTTWSVLIPFLIVGALGDVSTSGAAPAAPAGHYDFPIWIPAGATVGVQARTAHTVAQSLKVAAFAHGGNRNPASWWCGQRVTAIGITEAESTGTQHTADASGSFSTWTDLGSTLTADCGALQFGVNGPQSGLYQSKNYQFEFGVASVRIGPPIFRSFTTSEAGWFLPTGPIFRQLAAGTQLMVRATCNTTAPQGLGVAAWAVH